MNTSEPCNKSSRNSHISDERTLNGGDMQVSPSIPTFLSVKLQREADGLDRLCDRFHLDMETHWALKDAARLIRGSAERQAKQAAQLIHQARG